MKLPEAHTLSGNSLNLATKQNTSFLYFKTGHLLFTIQITETINRANYFRVPHMGWSGRKMRRDTLLSG